jgi:alcohol dehydrogenase class IV
MTSMATHYNSVRSFVGQGSIDVLKTLLAGRSYAVVTSPGFHRRGWHSYVNDAEHICSLVGERPSPDTVNVVKAKLKSIRFEVLIALGGGAVIDVAKTVRSLWNYVGEDWVSQDSSACMSRPDFDLIAIPTTCGSGAEITPFSVVWDPVAKKKLSVASEAMLPTCALVDPSLMLSLPHGQLLASALDAFSHSLESLWNRNATPFTRPIAVEAVRLIADALPLVVEDRENLEAWEALCWASHMAGYVISQTRTALAHSMSYPVTIHFGVPHGIASSMFLPEIAAFNYDNDESGVFREVVDLHFGGKAGLVGLIGQLFEQVEFYRHLSTVSNASGEGLMSIVDEMFAPQRALNNVVSVDRERMGALVRQFIGHFDW